MSVIYSAVCRLVGKCLDDSAIDELADIVGEYPLQIAANSKTGCYKFTHAGITLVLDEREKCFSEAILDATSGNRALPAHLEWGDAPDVVELKFSKSPISSSLSNEPYEDKVLWETYTIDNNICARFAFKKGLCLCSITVAQGSEESESIEISRELLVQNRKYWQEL